MNRKSQGKQQDYYRRSRRAAWWASGVCGILVAISIAEGQFDQGFSGLCLVAAFLLFVWGVDYHRRLQRPESTTPIA